MNKYKTLLGNTLIFAIGTIGSRAITFLLVPLYTNVLTQDQYGTADFVMTCAQMIVPLISFVIQDAILRFGLSESESCGKVAKNGFYVLLAGTAITFLLCPLFGLYGALSRWKWYLVFLIVSSNANEIIFTYAKVKDQNKLYAAGSILQTLVLAIVNILLLVVRPCGVKGYLIANIAAYTIPTLLVVAKTHVIRDIRGAAFDQALLIRMLKYSVPLIANNLSWWVLTSSDRVMIEALLSPADLGLYTAASKLPALVSIITTIFANAWTISSIKEYDSEQDRQFFANVFGLFSLAMHLAAACVIGITKPFMSIYVGADFFSSWSLVPVLVLGAVYYAYASFFGGIYSAVRKNIAITVTTLIAASINILLNLLLLKKIGVFAAVLSTGVGYAAIGLIRMFHSRKYFGFDIDFARLAINSIILLIQTVFVTLDIAGYCVSLTSIILLLLINRKSIGELLRMILTKFK